MEIEILMEDAEPIVRAICELTENQRQALLKLIDDEADIFGDEAALYIQRDLDDHKDEEDHEDKISEMACVSYDDLDWLEQAINYVTFYE